ncbi:MAG TPA: hypothetical protein VGT60_13025 [Candidatus Limnocylindria bacterium]|nr:hypothetical protein [Candidatus Limnocylindria bacterium]
MRALSALTLSACVFVGACAADPPSAGNASPSASARPTPVVPVIAFEPPGDTSQAPRYVAGRWTSNVPLLEVRFAVTPALPSACTVTVDPGRQAGGYACDGLLPPATDVRLELNAVTGQGAEGRATRNFRTMAERLSGVRWFTEFEDPNGEALACAAASVRIIQTFTTGHDVATARQILARGRPLNKSADPGIDPAAIARVITALEPTNRYHYYRFATREAATRAAVYWLVRSAKPVIALSLAGQHAPIITGYSGSIGPRLTDGKITGVVVEDPQRGDLDPLTAKHRPDTSRSAEFQTGKLIGIDEWYADDWWFRDSYSGSIVFNSDARLHDVDRNDTLYPRPHWGGTFVILVDDGDASNPPDREGRVAADGR